MWYKRTSNDEETDMEEFDKLPRNPNYRPKDQPERETQEEANERERARLTSERSREKRELDEAAETISRGPQRRR